MNETPRSRAFDPTYEPTKTWADLAKEFPDHPGIRMLAERDAALIAEGRAAPAPSPTLSAAALAGRAKVNSDDFAQKFADALNKGVLASHLTK